MIIENYRFYRYTIIILTLFLSINKFNYGQLIIIFLLITELVFGISEESIVLNFDKTITIKKKFLYKRKIINLNIEDIENISINMNGEKIKSKKNFNGYCIEITTKNNKIKMFRYSVLLNPKVKLNKFIQKIKEMDGNIIIIYNWE